MDTVRRSTKPDGSEQNNGVVLGLGAVGVVLLVAAGWWGVRSPTTPVVSRQIQVSQRGRAFSPSSLVVARGDVVRIVNDDGDLSHHAYVAAPTFSFDSGDQEPGRDVLVTFDVPGTFNVLCGIHPKMRLAVTVK